MSSRRGFRSLKSRLARRGIRPRIDHLEDRRVMAFDLEASAGLFTPAGPFNAGDTFDFDGEITNNGDPVMAGDAEYGLYVSVDTDLDFFSDDENPVFDIIPALAMGATAMVSHIGVSLPDEGDPFWQTNGPGTYYLGFFVDDFDDLAESDETNNTFVQAITVNVVAVNDEPTFDDAGDQTVDEDAGPQNIANFITNFQAGPAGEFDEALQSLVGYTVTVTGTTGNLAFSVAPSIGIGGNLQFTTAPHTNGTAIVEVTAQDDGGTADGGVDTSAVHTFTIFVDAVNDRPTFDLIANHTQNENLGPTTVPSVATNFLPGPLAATDEAGQTLVGYTVTVLSTTDTLAFDSGPTIDNAGNLSFETTANTNGQALVQVVAQDNGGTANGGLDLSLAKTFTLTILPVSDYGDAPESYLTTALVDGPRHRVTAGVGPLLGSLRDIDVDGQPGDFADGDDSTGTDDEDGVAFFPFAGFGPVIIGLNNTITVTVTGAPGKFEGFIDFDGDGTFAGAGEQIFDSLPLTVGVHVLTFAAPISSTPGTTYARFRISTLGGLSFSGPAPDGEVEDYCIQLAEAAPGIYPQDDLLHPGQTEIVIFGSDAKDKVTATKSKGQLQINFNGAKSSYALANTRLRIDVRGESDKVDISNSLLVPATIFGGSGNDTLTGGGAADVILGGSGNDKLNGRNKRDILIGGEGQDDLRGGADDDLLVGGSTDYDLDLAALGTIDFWWSSAYSYAARSSWVRNGTGIGGVPRLSLDEITDTEVDKLRGEGGRDLFYSSAGDVLTGKKPDEHVIRPLLS